MFSFLQTNIANKHVYAWATSKITHQDTYITDIQLVNIHALFIIKSCEYVFRLKYPFLLDLLSWKI